MLKSVLKSSRRWRATLVVEQGKQRERELVVEGNQRERGGEREKEIQREVEWERERERETKYPECHVDRTGRGRAHH